MAGQNTVKLTFAGDSQDLERSFDRVGAASEDMGRQASDQASKLDRLGEAGGTAETRFLGLGAGISGVSTIMSGDAGPEDYAMALADLGDSIEHTVIPVIKTMGTQILTTGRAAVTSAAQHVVSAAKVVAGWVMMGIQATINAVKMAAAWLISLGPIGLVIAAIAGIIAVLVALGVGFDDIKKFAEAAWNFILDLMKSVWSWVQSNWPLLLAILTGPIGLAVLAIKTHWQTIMDGVTAVKDWIVARFEDLVGFITGLPGRFADAAAGIWNWITDGVSAAVQFVIEQINRVIAAFNRLPGPDIATIGGGKGGRPITRKHTGGIFRAPAGQTEGWAMLRDGERVSSAGAGGNTFIIQGSILAESQLLKIVADAKRRGALL